MNRRKFFKTSTLAGLGTAITGSIVSNSVLDREIIEQFSNAKAKNIILMVSDGMSSGTLQLTDTYLQRLNGKPSNWMQLYIDRKVTRSLMDMASLSSIVTDSAAASSSWGGGHRVMNGSINTGVNGEIHMPIAEKFKRSGKKVGMVTTVAVTHATPAGFSVATKSRNNQETIAEIYLDKKYDVLLGGGLNFFDPNKRKDKKNLLNSFKNIGYEVVLTKNEMQSADDSKSLLGLFDEDGLMYAIDRGLNPEKALNTPTLAEMTKAAINHLKSSDNGFVLQIESGKVDWAAHANDAATLIHEQIQFDQAIDVVMKFAESDGNTLVIITTDHGNSNPGLLYSKTTNERFDRIQSYRASNETLLNKLNSDSSLKDIKLLTEQFHNFKLSDAQANELQSYYKNLEKNEDGLYNYRKVPFYAYSQMQKDHIAVNWISMDHSGDYVELAAYGPGSTLIPGFLKNTDLHYLMLQAAEIENNF